MADIRLRNVNKRFGSVQVINDVSLDIEDGEFCVFVGPSGCGKSTLLRMVAGLEEITTGELEIGGKRVTRLPPSARGVAMVFQSYALYPHMTVYDNMAFGLELAKAGKAEIDARVRRAAEILRSARCCSACPRNCRAASASAWRSAGRSCAHPASSCSTSRSPTSMPRSASRPGSRSPSSTRASMPA